MKQIAVIVKNGEVSDLNEKLEDGWKYVTAHSVAQHVSASVSCGGGNPSYEKIDKAGKTIILVILEKEEQ